MIQTTVHLIENKQLTHDVYELIYSCEDMKIEPIFPGHYVLFQLAPGLNRAYSFARIGSNHFTLIIKRIPEGRGSPILCDAPIGTSFRALLPLGHFLLQKTGRNKCFIGTGTGFAPLYCQALGTANLPHPPMKISFIFGVRNLHDAFYEDELQSLGSLFQEFTHTLYLSRESHISPSKKGITIEHGYVTDWITETHIHSFEEFYLCGSPAMVKDARNQLEGLGIKKENIFWEQF